jgi:hypothetical protein
VDARDVRSCIAERPEHALDQIHQPGLLASLAVTAQAVERKTGVTLPADGQ